MLTIHAHPEQVIVKIVACFLIVIMTCENLIILNKLGNKISLFVVSSLSMKEGSISITLA